RYRERRAQPGAGAGAGLDVRARRGRAPETTEAGPATVPRPPTRCLRTDRRGRDGTGNGVVATWYSVPGDAVDDADHAERDPTCGVRGRRGRTRTSAAVAAAHGHGG